MNRLHKKQMSAERETEVGERVIYGSPNHAGGSFLPQVPGSSNRGHRDGQNTRKILTHRSSVHDVCGRDTYRMNERQKYWKIYENIAEKCHFSAIFVLLVK